VVLDILGVRYVDPKPRDTPPTESEYQLIIPALELAPKVTIPVPQFELSVTDEILGSVLIVAVTALLLAVVHPLDVAST